MNCDATPVAEESNISAETSAVKSAKTDESSNHVSVCRGGVKEIAPGRFEVDREIFDEQPFDYLSGQIRIIPHYQRGKPAGFKIVGVRSGSLYSSLGFKSGDILKSIAGNELNSINRAFQLFEELKLSELASLEVTLERETRLITHHYDFVNSADCKQSAEERAKERARRRPKLRTRKRLSQRRKERAKQRAEESLKDPVTRRFRIARALVIELTRDPDQIYRQGRVVPRYRRGEPSGFKVFGIRRRSIFKSLQLKNGDTITSVDGKEVTSPDKLLSIIGELHQRDQLTLEIKRRGRRYSYHYEIK